MPPYVVAVVRNRERGLARPRLAMKAKGEEKILALMALPVVQTMAP
jgi:hypothetical protein